MLNYTALYYFLELCSARSFTLAAEKLHMTRSNLSISIKKLEEELGFSLFYRTHNGVTLTEKGEKVAEYAKIAFSAFEKIEDLAILPEVCEEIVIYSSSGIGAQYIPFIMDAYYKRYPQGRFISHEIEGQSIEQILQNDKKAIILDIFDTTHEFPSTIQHIILDKCAPVLIMDKTATFVSPDIKSIALKDVIELPLVLISNKENNYFQTKIITSLSKHGEPNIVFCGQNMNMLLPLISNKIGVTFYPAFKSLLNIRKFDQFRFINIKRAPQFILAVCYNDNISEKELSFISSFLKTIFHSPY